MVTLQLLGIIFIVFYGIFYNTSTIMCLFLVLRPAVAGHFYFFLGARSLDMTSRRGVFVIGSKLDL